MYLPYYNIKSLLSESKYVEWEVGRGKIGYWGCEIGADSATLTRTEVLEIFFGTHA